MNTFFVWSVAENLRSLAYPSKNPISAFQNSCEISDWDAINPNSNGMRISFTFTPSSRIDLNAGGFKLVAYNVKDNADSRKINSKCEIALSDGWGKCITDGFRFLNDLTITASSTNNIKPLGGNKQTVYLWVDQGSTVKSNRNWYLEILIQSFKIDECNKANQKLIPMSSFPDNGNLTLSSLNYIPTQKIRSNFNFTFSLSVLYRKILIDTKFNFYLGWFGENFLATKLNCKVYENGKVSFAWKSIKLLNGILSIVPISELAGNKSFTIACYGGNTTCLQSSNEFFGTWGDTSYNYTTSNIIPRPKSLDQPQKCNLILKSKILNGVGLEAAYVFSFSLKLSYSNAARLSLEFHNLILPSFNRFGRVPSCYLDEEKVPCRKIHQRKLMVEPMKALLASVEYQLKIYGISQAHPRFVFDQISFGVDNDTDLSNGISEFTEVKDINPLSVLIGFKINGLNFSTNKTKAFQNIEINMTLPVNGIVIDSGIIYVEIPGFYKNIMKEEGLADCMIQRISIPLDDDFVKNCSYQPNGLIKIYTKSDALNLKSAQTYKMTLRNIPTPENPSINEPNYITVFYLDNNQERAYGRTASGNILGSFPNYYEPASQLNWFAYKDMTYKQLNSNQIIECFIGYYSPVIYLGAEKENNIATRFEFDTMNISFFSNTDALKVGSQYLPVKIGATPNTKPGNYLIYTKLISASATEYRILNVNVSSKPCGMFPSKLYYELPLGTKNYSITFDFEQCVPYKDITIIGQLNSNNYGVYFINGEKSLSKELVFNNQISNWKITFGISSTDLTAQIGSIINITWVFQGSNAASYVFLNNKTKLSIVHPLDLDLPLADLAAGESILSIRCSQTGKFYYVAGVSDSSNKFNQIDIQSRTEDKNKPDTTPDSGDANYLIFGFGLIQENQINVNLINRVKSSGNYTARAFCVNSKNKVSVKAAQVNWIQADNGGKTVKLTATFKTPLPSNKKVAVACSISKTLNVSSKNVMTDEGKSCTTSRFRIIQGQTNEQTSYTANFYIYPDVLAPVSDSQTTITEKLKSPTIISEIIGNTPDSYNLPQFLSLDTTVINITNYATPVPQIKEEDPITYINNEVKFSLSLINGDGYFYAGLGRDSNLTPNVKELRQGLSGNGDSTLDNFTIVSAKNGTKTNIALVGKAMENKNWKIYYAASNDDPGIDMIYTEVYEKWLNLTSKNTYVESLLYSMTIVVFLCTAVLLI